MAGLLLLLSALFPGAAAFATAAEVASAFTAAKLAQIDETIEACVRTNGMPGAVFWLEHRENSYHRAYGSRALVPKTEAMTDTTVFDLASLTKVVATAPSILLLVERGLIRLDAPAQTYLPEFQGQGKERITVHELLTHTSGLKAGLTRTQSWSGYSNAIELACAEIPVHPPGSNFLYSDINFIVLGEIIQRTSRRPLAAFTREEIFEPLGMNDTGYLPGAAVLPRIAPTEVIGGKPLRGTVHDPTARRMRGVAGHAGVFSTVHDLSRFCRMMLNGGSLDGTRLLQPATVQEMTRVQTAEAIGARRGFGWDIDSDFSRPRGKHFPLGSFGHSGFTGTCLWIDPFSKSFWIFLSNRVHPTRQGNVLHLQAQLATMAAEAIVGFNFAGVVGALPPRPERPGANKAGSADGTPAQVLNGIDVLARQDFAPLRGKKIGLITNHTGHDRSRRATLDRLHDAPGIVVKTLFSPEHGIRGVADENVGDSIDEKTGIPIVSLYGDRRAPSEAQLQGLDALVFDIQDIGCRFYTYISTLGLCLQAAGKAAIPFFVLDRINPINGTTIEGPTLTDASSFTAFHPIPIRHGMTVGELAGLFNAERNFQTTLHVIPVEGWRRDLWLDETGLPWTNPSPNMRRLSAAILYPGIGLLEMTHLSVGRGTETPFEVIGAPYIDELRLTDALRQRALAGVRFTPVRFKPTGSTFKDKVCSGVSIIVTDRNACEVVRMGITVAEVLQQMYPREFGLEKVQKLLGHAATREALAAGQSAGKICDLWTSDLVQFRQRREPFLLYR